MPLDRGRRGARVDDATEATEPKGYYRWQKRTPRFGIATWRTLFQASSLSILLSIESERSAVIGLKFDRRSTYCPFVNYSTVVAASRPRAASTTTPEDYTHYVYVLS